MAPSATPALQVLHALIFDFLNHRTGRLDPSYAAIARKANVCERTVATALARLRELGILHWVRRCAESWRDGRFVLEQETNAYAVLPESQWRGYRPPQEPPAPAPSLIQLVSDFRAYPQPTSTPPTVPANTLPLASARPSCAPPSGPTANPVRFA